MTMILFGVKYSSFLDNFSHIAFSITQENCPPSRRAFAFIQNILSMRFSNNNVEMVRFAHHFTLFKSFSFFNKTLFQNDTQFYSTISGLLGIEHHKNHFSTLFQQKTKLTIFIKLTCIFVIPIISIYRTRL